MTASPESSDFKNPFTVPCDHNIGVAISIHANQKDRTVLKPKRDAKGEEISCISRGQK